MKKMILLCAAVMLLAGCTKNYKTVDEYETAMKAVRDGNPSYTIELKQTLPTVELYYKSSMKGDKWKTEMSMNGGSSYMSTILFDGTDLLSYSQGSPYAVKNPAVEMAKDSENLKEIINSQNPASSLFNWKEGNVLFAFDGSAAPDFIDNKASKNGFECRMIKFGENREACISDKYGIAVYEKVKYENPRNKNVEDMTLNVVKIDTTDVPDSTFELPAGVQKMDLDKMLDKVSNMLKGM